MPSNEEQELDLRELAQILWKRKTFIAIITICAVLAAGIISYFILTPQYEASAEILVNQERAEGEFVSSGDIDTNRELMNTYQVVMSSPRVLDVVIEEYNLPYTYSNLEGKMNVSAVDESQVMSITVTDESHEQAIYMANAVAETFQNEIQEIMSVDNVHIMAAAQASENPSPVAPRPTLNMAIAFVVGLMTAVGIAFLLEYLDNTLKSEQDIEKVLDVPVLGTIMEMEEPEGQRISAKHVRSVRGEQIES